MTAAPPHSDSADTARFAADDVCVIVPVYNEAQVLAHVLGELRQRFDLIVVVDDASTDQSAAIAHATRARVLSHPINLGQGAALQTGLTYALKHTRSRVIVTFDGDGQHVVSDAVELAERILSGDAPIALGSRFLADADAEDVPPLRRAVLRLGVVFTRLSTRLRVTDTHNGLRALHRSAAERIDLRLRGMAHASEFLRLVADHGIDFVEVPVHIRYTDHSRGKGQSNLNAVNIVADVFLQGVFRNR
jgi:glycosyltransferase involved in cell wall biosynthesis